MAIRGEPGRIYPITRVRAARVAPGRSLRAMGLSAGSSFFERLTGE